MNKTKENRGISLVVLIITITLLLIIASATIYMGRTGISETQDQLLLKELEQINFVVGECYTNYIKFKNSSFLYGEKLTSAEITSFATENHITLITIPNTYNEKERAYYRLTPEMLNKLGVENCSNSYIVNYLSGETMNETKPAISTGKTLYTYTRNNFTDYSNFSTNNSNQVDYERNLFNSL